MKISHIMKRVTTQRIILYDMSKATTKLLSRKSLLQIVRRRVRYDYYPKIEKILYDDVESKSFLPLSWRVKISKIGKCTFVQRRNFSSYISKSQSETFNLNFYSCRLLSNVNIPSQPSFE